MPESLDLALIGAGGRIAADWLAVANHADSPFRITKLVETEPVARARLGALPDLDALLEGERPAAAIVATPPATHAAPRSRGTRSCSPSSVPPNSAANSMETSRAGATWDSGARRAA